MFFHLKGKMVQKIPLCMVLLEMTCPSAKGKKTNPIRILSTAEQA